MENVNNNDQAAVVDVMAEVVGDVTCSTSIDEARTLVDIATRMGIKYETALGADMKTVTVTLKNVSDDQLAAFERKIRIGTWSRNVTGAMTRVSNFVSDTADFALNGAIAPAAIATGEAAARIVNVGGRAVVKTAAGLANSIAVNGTQMVLELATDPTIKDTKQTFKMIGSMIGNKLFGSTGSTRFSRVGAQTTNA